MAPIMPIHNSSVATVTFGRFESFTGLAAGQSSPTLPPYPCLRVSPAFEAWHRVFRHHHPLAPEGTH